MFDWLHSLFDIGAQSVCDAREQGDLGRSVANHRRIDWLTDRVDALVLDADAAQQRIAHLEHAFADAQRTIVNAFDDKSREIDERLAACCKAQKPTKSPTPRRRKVTK